MKTTGAYAPHRLWTVKDVQEFLSVSRSWVYQRVAAGDIPYVRVGGLVRFVPDAVRAYALGDCHRSLAVIPLRSRTD